MGKLMALGAANSRNASATPRTFANLANVSSASHPVLPMTRGRVCRRNQRRPLRRGGKPASCWAVSWLVQFKVNATSPLVLQQPIVERRIVVGLGPRVVTGIRIHRQL